MSQEAEEADRASRVAETVRLVVTRRERAPRSPGMERAFKKLLWRYTGELRETRTGRQDVGRREGRLKGLPPDVVDRTDEQKEQRQANGKE